MATPALKPKKKAPKKAKTKTIYASVRRSGLPELPLRIESGYFKDDNLKIGDRVKITIRKA